MIKSKKIETLLPPREIREITKQRRAWLNEQVERINAIPNRSARITGQGSYQVVAVYEVTEVGTRKQLRGTCQACGRVQALIDDTHIASHGFDIYFGYRRGTCQGSGYRPAEITLEYAKKIHASVLSQIEKEEKELAELAPLGMRPNFFSPEPSAEYLEWKKRRDFRLKLEGFIRDLKFHVRMIETHVFPAFGKELRTVEVPL